MVRHLDIFMETTSIYELSREITKRRLSIIAIDGHLGVGKTTVANLLSSQLGFECIHLDSYLTYGKSRFVEYLDYSSLEKATSRRPILIEGICLLEVLKKLNISAELFIYIDGLKAKRQNT